MSRQRPDVRQTLDLTTATHGEEEHSGNASQYEEDIGSTSQG